MNTTLSFRSGISTTAAPSQDYFGRHFRDASITMVDSDREFQILKEKIDSFQSYEDDWDDNDGKPASDAVACLACAISRYGAIACLTRGLGWRRPSVSLLNDGSISLLWSTTDIQAYFVIGPGDDDIRAIFHVGNRHPFRVDLTRDTILNFVTDVAPDYMRSF
jgi:hypothetical protein